MTKKIKTLFKLIKTVKNYPIYILDFLGFKNGKVITYKLYNGLRYQVRGGTTDRFIINEIWLHKTYTPYGFEIKENDIVIDVGAHIGIFTIFAAHCAKNGKIYAFEPVKENFQLMKKNLSLNRKKNVFAFNRAVSNSEGNVNLYVSKERNRGQNSFIKLADNYETRIVDKMNFKKIIKTLPRVDFLKMDCEGAEYDILFSLSKNEMKKIKKISMEYHNYALRNGEEIARFLKDNNFNVWIKRGKIFGTIYAKLDE